MSKWTPEEDAVLIEMWGEYRAAEISDRLPGRTEKAVKQRCVLLRRAGHDLAKMHSSSFGEIEWTPALDGQLAALWRDGHKVKHIARALGVQNPRAIYRRAEFLRARGFDVPARGGGWATPRAVAEPQTKAEATPRTCLRCQRTFRSHWPKRDHRICGNCSGTVSNAAPYADQVTAAATYG